MQSTSISDLIHESNKPLARYRDDADLDAYQRSVVRDGDPMAKYLAKKQNKENSDKPGIYREILIITVDSDNKNTSKIRNYNLWIIRLLLLTFPK